MPAPPIFVYLDQSTLSNLASDRMPPDVRTEFLNACANRQMCPVLSTAHVYETWKHGAPDVRTRIAKFADSIVECHWMINHRLVSKGEVEAAFFRFCGFAPAALIPFRKRMKDAYYENVEGAIELILEDFTFSYMLQRFESDPPLRRGFEEWQGMQNVLPHAMRRAAQSHASRGRAAVRKSMWEVVAKHVRELLPNHLPDGEIPSIAVKEQFVATVPWERYSDMPYTYLWSRRILEMSADLQYAAEPSELIDWFHLAALPYVKAFLCDSRTKSFVERSKVPYAVIQSCFVHLKDAISFLAVEAAKRPPRNDG